MAEDPKMATPLTGWRAWLAAATTLVTFSLAASGQEIYQAQPDPASPAGIPFQGYFTKDRLGRRIIFYASRTASPGAKVPLAVFILGSGAYSQFLVKNGKILHAQRDFLEVLDGHACLIIVEKPGVKFAEQPERRGTAIGSSAEFRREHTLERWVEAISAALRAARTLPGIDLNYTLVVGHSEGAQVGASVAASNPFVTHVACLAGAGPTQLFAFLREARLGRIQSEGVTADEQVHRVLAQWDEMLRNPDPDKMWFGHSYAYWASFMRSSALEELPRTNARILVARGSEDDPDAVWNIDLIRATLLAHGKDVTAFVVEGANHGFQFPHDPSRDGWREIQQRVVQWFVAGMK